MQNASMMCCERCCMFVFVLHAYPSHHHEQVARELLEAKCNVDHQNNQGVTALMYASQNGHEEVRRSGM